MQCWKINSRWAVRTLMGILLCGNLPSFAYADITLSQLDKNIAFKIDEDVFTHKGFQQFYALATQQSAMKPTSKIELLEGLIENHLLAMSNHEEERQEPQQEHHDHHDDHSDQHAKKHDHELELYADTYTEYKGLLVLMGTAKTSTTLDQIILPIDAEELSLQLQRFLYSSVGDKKGTTKNRILIREDFTSDQKEQAKSLVVGQYRLPKQQVHTVSYWDVYRFQSIQNRAKIRRGDMKSIDAGVRQWVKLKLLEYNVKALLALTDEDLQTLWNIVWDKKNKQQYYLETGIVMDLHHDQPLLEEFKQKITNKAVKAYYLEHQAEFIQVGSVVARHITVATQNEADKVYDKLKSGLDFNEAIERYSLSQDNGSLGFINRRDKNLSFVKKLALIQAVGKVSTPYRMLDGKSYEIILVDKKQPEPLPLSDKSVQNQITNILAVKEAKKDLELSFSRWIKQRRIILNSEYFKNAKSLFSDRF